MFSQHVQISSSHNTGSHLYIGNTITAPGSGTNLINLSGTAKVNYKASESISLKNGFNSGQFENGGFFHAFISSNQLNYGGEMISDFEFNNYSPNTQLEPGYIDYSKGVDQSGAAYYNIPIKVPIGTGNATPSLSISYNSQSGNGILGMGWNISGLSSINRVPKNFYSDYKVEQINLNSDDKYSLDGQRLVSVNGFLYTELESNSVITPIGVSNSSPLSFSVNSPDGINKLYGNTEDSRFLKPGTSDILSWMINKETDQNGNYIKYIYKIIDNELLLDRIVYSGNDALGLLPYNTIKFKYIARLDTNTAYYSGCPIRSKSLLKEIVLISDGLAFKTYKFDYGYNIFSYLSKVTEIGSDGNTMLNSTIFEYGQQQELINNENTPLLFEGMIDKYPVDFNNDGLTDLFIAGYSLDAFGSKHHTSFSLYLKSNNGEEFNDPITGSYSNVPNLFETPNRPNGSFNQSPLDYTGDGLGDVLSSNIEIEQNGDTDPSNNFFRLDALKILAFNGLDGFQEFNLPLMSNYNRISTSRNYLFSGDFDGDKTEDYLTVLFNNSDPSDCKASISFPRRNLFNIPLIYENLSEWAIANRTVVYDYDGDGKQELWTLKDDGSANTIFKIFSFSLSEDESSVEVNRLYEGERGNFTDKFIFGDFNGDGKTDFIHKNSQDIEYNLMETYPLIGQVKANYTINYSKGNGDNGFEVGEFDVSFPFWEEHSGSLVDLLKVGDYNGDGKTDLILGYIYNFKENYQIYYSNGKGFQKRTYQDEDSFVLELDPDNFYISGDFNGNGKLDELKKEEAFSIFYFNKDSKEGLLTKAKDGFGRTVEFEYSWLPKETVYTPQENPQSYPLCNFESPLPVVSKMILPDGVGSETSIEYRYKNAITHKGGKGFLGFTKIETINNTSGISTETEYYIDQLTDNHNQKSFVPFIKSQKNWKTTDPSNITLQVDNRFVIKRLGNEKRYAVKLGSTSSKNNLLGISQESTFEYFDLFDVPEVGFPKKTIEKYYSNNNLSGSYIEKIEVEYGQSTGLGNGNIWLPSYSLKVGIRGNSSVQKKTSFEYYQNGNLKKQTEFSDKSSHLETDFEYDQFGNPKKISTSIDNENRSSIVNYDDKGRFAINFFNALNQKTEVKYDRRFGKLLEIKGPDGLIRGYEYDPFGKLIKSIDPHGNETNINFDWAIGTIENSIFKIRSLTPNYPEITTLFDAFGRKRFSSWNGMGGLIVCSETKYNSRGDFLSVTEPFQLGSPPVLNNYSYDEFGRPISITNGISTSSLSYSGTSTTFINPSGHSFTRIEDGAGRLVTSTDQGGTLNYIYDGFGNLLQTSSGGNTLVSLEYEPNFGWKKKLIDSNGGEINYNFDLLGRLINQTDALQQSTSFEYDHLDRPITKTNSEGVSTYEYVTNGNGLNQLKRVVSPDGSYQEFSYDSFSRNIQFKEKHGNYTDIFNSSFTYDNQDRLVSIKYPSGFQTIYEYDSYGYLSKIKGPGNYEIFKPISTNARGQLTQFNYGNGLVTNKSYNDYGFLEHTISEGVQDIETFFNPQNGNLESRTDNIKQLNENFGYDNLDRLINVSPNNSINGNSISNSFLGPFSETISYSPNGNILSKTGLGAYLYENSNKPNAVTSIENNHVDQSGDVSPLISLHQQDVTYKNDRPSKILENNFEYNLKYGPDANRMVSELKQNGELLNRRFYSLNYEKLELGNEIYQINYIPGLDGLASIYVKKNNDPGSYFYAHTDHLGSIVSITNAEGNIVQEFSYDAWGRSRNPNNWSYILEPNSLAWLNRGYTSQEHILEFNLINMNARLYDPTVGRFLAVDNFVGDPALSQSYNRYSYCLNNPLKYTDPSGERAEPSNPNNEFEQVSDWNEADGVFDNGNFEYNLLAGDPDEHKSKDGKYKKTVIDRDGTDNEEGDEDNENGDVIIEETEWDISTFAGNEVDGGPGGGGIIRMEIRLSVQNGSIKFRLLEEIGTLLGANLMPFLAL